MSKDGIRAVSFLAAVLAIGASAGAGMPPAPAGLDYGDGRGIGNRKGGYRGGGSFGNHRPTKWEKENHWPAHLARIEANHRRKLDRARYNATISVEATDENRRKLSDRARNAEVTI